MPVKMSVKSFEPWAEGSLYDQIDLDEDMEWNYQLLDLPTSEFLTSSDENELMAQIDQQTHIPKYTIRNHDCMWSGRCIAHPEKSKCQANSGTISTQNNCVNKNTTFISHQQLQFQQQMTINMKQQQIQQIPAGRSLLLNSRPYQPKSLINKLPTITTTDFLKDREPTVRPDTPISLDDDPPEFKHTIDLAACTMGSNQISLINNADEDTSIKIINLLKEHLEDTSTDNSHVKHDLRPFLTTHKSESLSDLLNEMKYLSDFEELDDDDDDDSNVEMDSDSESGSSHISSSELDKKIIQYQATHVADHSYTRPKNRVDIDSLGVQTPSDSEEEIDVVSVGDKTLPTNPSARDRRALQTTVADKITARMVTTARGIKTLPPRRRCSEESNSTSCSSTPTKINVSNNLLPNYSLQCSVRDTIPTSRKRSQKETNNNPKRHRGKKQRTSPQSSSGSSSGKRQNSDSDEADTIEKRNLHNDMERQRRIGLKNLFEELKRQIPSIRDKERAPKVSILREAAALCSRLNCDQDQVTALKKQQQRLLHRVKILRTTMATKWG